MQIQSTNNQNFCALKCEPNYNEIVMHIAKKSSSIDNAIKCDKYLKVLNDNYAVTNLFLTGDPENPKLYAKVGRKLFKENWLYGPLTVLKKALKKSDIIEAHYNYNHHQYRNDYEI